MLNAISLTPHSRCYMPAAAGRSLPRLAGRNAISFMINGASQTPGVGLLELHRAPHAVTLAGQPLTTFEYSAENHPLPF